MLGSWSDSERLLAADTAISTRSSSWSLAYASTAATGVPASSCRIAASTGRASSAWKEEHNTSHRQVRARVEHAFTRKKTWKVLRDCRLNGDGVHHAMSGIANSRMQYRPGLIAKTGLDFQPPQSQPLKISSP